MNKIFVMSLLFLTFYTAKVRSQNSQTRLSIADSVWNQLQAEVFSKDNSTSSDFSKQEARCLKYREEGLKFWKRFPNDIRRYKWLYQTTTLLSPLYLEIKENDTAYKVILYRKIYQPVQNYSWPINKASLENWNKIFPKLKTEFLIYYANNPKLNYGSFVFPGKPCQQIELIVGELREYLNLSLNAEYRGNKKINIEKLKNLLVEAAKYFGKQRPTRVEAAVYYPMRELFTGRYREYGLTQEDMIDFFNSMKENSNPLLQRWAIQQFSLFALMQNPLTLKHVSTTGNIIDLEKMRGRVVLVDFWSTNCSSCIDRMPEIKKVYDKYKNQGFEVISACLANNDELEKIKAIENKIGADWPMLLIGKPSNNNSLGQQIFQKYGFWGVPQLLLLNKKGELVMYNSRLSQGDFEPEVKKLLTENYNVN